MSLKIRNKQGKVIARLEDDFSEPEMDEEETCKCKEKCEKCEHEEASEELTESTKEEGDE